MWGACFLLTELYGIFKLRVIHLPGTWSGITALVNIEASIFSLPFVFRSCTSPYNSQPCLFWWKQSSYRHCMWLFQRFMIFFFALWFFIILLWQLSPSYANGVPSVVEWNFFHFISVQIEVASSAYNSSLCNSVVVGNWMPFVFAFPGDTDKSRCQ